MKIVGEIHTCTGKGVGSLDISCVYRCLLYQPPYPAPMVPVESAREDYINEPSRNAAKTRVSPGMTSTRLDSI